MDDPNENGVKQTAPALDDVSVTKERQQGTERIDGQDSEDLVNKDAVLAYGITDVPPWYMCILLGFQHYLTMFGSTVAVPLILAEPLGIANDNVAKGQVISTIFFASGIATLLQTTIGNRLPIIQGAAFSFLTPAIAIMLSIPLPNTIGVDANDTINATINGTINATTNATTTVPADFWKVKMVQVQGAIMVASVTQILLGFAGVIGLLMSRIGPLTIAPTITLVGLSLFGAAGDFAGRHWGIAFFTMFLIILFSQHLRNVEIPIPRWKQKPYRLKFFSLFPVILAVLLSWSFCAILTAVGAFPSLSSQYGYHARTDINIGVVSQAAWFRVPYPGQWGLPIVTASGVLGMVSGVLASIIESIGDYYACARLCSERPPPTHALNRGIFIEGIGCIIAGALGTGNGTTSYSENIGAIGITKVGSRRVVQTGAVIMLILAVIGKFGALFTTIPDPVIGGMFCVMFGMIAAVGMSNLQFVDLNSSRNLLVMGFSTFIGIALPEWIKKNNGLISTGSAEADQIILVLLQTGMFIGGLVAFILDNTIPGTLKERGMTHWMKLEDTSDEGCKTSIYDFPDLLQKQLNRVAVFRYIPICPTFRRNDKPSLSIANPANSDNPDENTARVTGF